MAKKISALLCTVSMLLITHSAQADFVAVMSSDLGQLQAEAEAQLRANPDITQLISRAAAANIHMPTLMRALVRIPAVNLPNAVGAAVRAVPAQGVDIVGYAALYGPSAQAAAIITAGIQAAPAQANAMLRVVLGALFGKNAVHQQVFQAAIAAAPDQLDSLIESGMRGPIGRADTEWVAVAAVRVNAPVNVVVSSAIRTDPPRTAAIISAVLRAGASPALVGTAALNAGVALDTVTAAFSSARIPFAGQIQRLTITSGPTARLGQTISLLLEGNGICGMQANWGDARPLMSANRANFWGVPFNISTPRTAGRYVFSVGGMANGTLPACQGLVQTTVDIIR